MGPYIFGTNESGSIYVVPRLSTGETSLSLSMRFLWKSLVANKDSLPSGAGWLSYDAARDNHLWLMEGTAPLPEGEEYHGPACDAWDRIWNKEQHSIPTNVAYI